MIIIESVFWSFSKTREFTVELSDDKIVFYDDAAVVAKLQLCIMFWICKHSLLIAIDVRGNNDFAKAMHT